MSVEVTEEIPMINSFEEMGLPDNLLRGIYGHGFEKPSAIQSKAIMPMIQGRDILAQAQSGTGKTGTFVIGSLYHVDTTLNKPQVLILTHVRELAEQIYNAARAFGAHMGIKALWAVGGNPLSKDIQTLEDGCHFVTGTPGRIYDLVNRGALDLSNIRYLVMDEADVMLEDLFYKQVMCILEKGFPSDVKVALFSATWSDKVIEMANKILQNPVRILMPPAKVKLEGIRQFYINLDRADHKFECICDLYKHLNITQAIIFCNKKQTADMLSEKMGAQGYPLTCLHGDLDKNERQRRMEMFKRGETRVLIATDIISRGIDIQTLSLVINYELPTNVASYIHRIGRAGRYGRKGTTINLLLPEEESMMKQLCDHYELNITPFPNDTSGLVL